MRRFLTWKNGSRSLLDLLARSVCIGLLLTSSLGCEKKEVVLETDPGVRFVKEGQVISAPWDGVLLRMDVHDKAVLND